MKSWKSTTNRHKGVNQKWTRKGGTGSNFRWSPSTSRFLISYISEQAKLLGNPNFKRRAFMNASQVVSDRYGISVTDTNVLNHVRTIKGRYRLVRKLQSLENVTWDEEKKMVVMNQDDYDRHIKENPKDEPFLNKPIDMYDEICIICEDSNPTAQNLSDSDNEEMRDSDNEIEDFAKETDLTPPHESSPQVLAKRKRTRGQNGSASTTKKGSSNFRWSPYMSRLLMSYIVDQIKLGLLKRQILVTASQFVREKTDLNCSVVNVENHLRTLRGRFLRIKKLQNLEGVTWDDERKMILMDEEAYNEHIKNEPKDEPYLNKKIDMYEEMVIIYDNEQVGNDLQNEIDAIDNEQVAVLTDGLDQIQNENDAQDQDRFLQFDQIQNEQSSSPKSPHISPLNNGECNGNNNECGDQSGGAKWATSKLMTDLSTKMGSLAKSMGDLANAVKVSSERGICKELYREVMKCEGYNEILLGKAFDYLNEHGHLGRGFLVKSQKLRHAWLSEFFCSRGHVL